jgi:F-type H+-transporting ATPase subunit b
MRNRRQTAGMTTSEWGKVAFGLVVIVLGATVVKGGFLDQSPIPGIDFQWGRTVVMIGFVLLMFPVIKSFFLVPLGDAINTRNADLERTFTEAEELRASMTKLRAEYEQRLNETEASAREQIQSQIREAQNLRQTLMSEAAAKADALLEQAAVQIEQEKSKALLEIRSAVVDLTMSATEKVIGANLDEARSRKLVEEFIAGVEAAH